MKARYERSSLESLSGVIAENAFSFAPAHPRGLRSAVWSADSICFPTFLPFATSQIEASYADYS